jgi:pimeloyl-ACP methyl ester carboxylesterase
MVTAWKSTSHVRRIVALSAVLVLSALVLSGGEPAAIVLVHGDWADASSWNRVVPRLQDRGFSVVAPPNTLRGPSQDAPYLASYLATIAGPIVLVAHSYGGFVITNAATGNANVRALVYIDSFAPDENETAFDLVGNSGSCVTDDGAFKPVPIIGGLDLYLNWEANLDYEGFTTCFANGVDPGTAAVLHAGQRPASAAQFSDPSGVPAWKTIPSWALLGTQDNVIPPTLQRFMYERAAAQVTSVKAGHLSLITRPDAVIRVILSAVDATT